MSAKLLLAQHDDLCKTAKDLMTRKNHDYTSGSGDPFANFRGSSYLGIDPVLGVMLRMQDKMMRVRTFAEKGELKVKDEGVKDALVDLINYTVLMYGLIEEGKSKTATVETGRIPLEVMLERQTARAAAAPLLSGASAREWHDRNQKEARATLEADGFTHGGTG